MTQATARQAAPRSGQLPDRVRQAVAGIGLLQIVIIVLAVTTALVHLDKALMLGFPFGHSGGMPSGMPAGSHGGAPGSALSGVGRRPAGPPLSLPLPLPV